MKFIIKILTILLFLNIIIISFDSVQKDTVNEENTTFTINQNNNEVVDAFNGNQILIKRKEENIKHNKAKEETIIIQEIEINNKKKEETLNSGKKIISGFSLIYGDVENISIIDYIDKSCSFFEGNLDIKLDRNLFLALLYQESRCNPSIKDGIAQITTDEPVFVANKKFYVKNKNNPISSIDWTIATFIEKYLALSEYRNSKDISEWYILKLHNSGTMLQDVRYLYKDEYPLTKEGDDLFIKDFESFDLKGKEMFKTYLASVGSDYCLDVMSNISETSTYEDYISSGKLFSDPRYISNIKQFY